jgi:non-canonical (house-cleaning) NTP pyrophosphatase
MKIVVGSTNPVKINATTIAACETWPEAEVKGVAVETGVSEQPRSDQETKQGAINRAHRAYQAFCSRQVEAQDSQPQPAKQTKGKKHQPFLAVGLEGGVLTDDQDQMWSTVWAAVFDGCNQPYLANGARFLVPDLVATRIKQGEEMGPIMSSLFQGRPVKKQEGMIGIITQNFIDRTEEYSSITKMALGLWYGRQWQKELK